MLLQGRVCVVAGVGPGLGRQVALLAADHGADVVLAARREATLEEVAAEIKKAGGRALSVPTDMTDAGQCQRLVDATLETFGRVDALVNNAYVEDVFKSFRRVDLDDWRRIVEVNLFGPLQLTQAFTPVFIEQQRGSIVFVNSMIVRKMPSHPEGGYAVAKGGLFTAARVLAKELARFGVRVNSVLPGWMWGPQVEAYVRWQSERRDISEEAVVAEITSDIPLGTIPTDAAVAGAVIFLASDLSSAMTGQAIDVNGGEVFA
jgi:NAD(P)-dependent dehydrogenase (short-subunit alcohol dehydrogenase family)